MAEPLTEDELFNVQFLWNRMPDVGYLEIVRDSEKLAPYFAKLKNHSVVEIGPGSNPITNYFPCKDYTFAEGHYPRDGLSVLRRMGDKSAIVVSFGVIDDYVLLDSLTSFRKQLCARYIDELVQEIKRVMNPFAIIFGRHATKYMGEIGEPSLGLVGYGGVYLQK